MSHPIVPFPRDIRLGTQGLDVIAHKRAISRWNPKFYPWQEFSNYAGPFFFNAVLEFKKEHGLGNAVKIGTNTHRALEKAHSKHKPTEWAFDAYAVQLATTYWNQVTKTPEERKREAIVAAAFFWYAHRYQIAYSESRPFRECKPPLVPYVWDCSAFAINCYYAAGAPDPSGWGYRGIGYTGNLIDHGRRVGSISELKKGDLIFYGFSSGSPGFSRGDPTHVAVYVGNNLVVSNGHHPMTYARYNYRLDVNQYRTYDMGV